MARFSAELTQRYPHASYDTAEEALDRANAARVPLTRAVDVSPVAKVPYKVRDLLQVGLRRSIELADAFVASFNTELFTPLFVLGRASLETGCLMWELYSRVSDIVERKDKGALNDFDTRAMNALFGAKTTAWAGDPAVHPALNILTIIDRQTKETPNLRDFYDALSEFAHPNHAGMFALYCDVKYDLHESHYVDRPFGEQAEALDLPVRALIAGVSQGVFAVELFERKLGEFTGLCEEAIHDSGTWPSGVAYPISRE